MVMWKVSIVTEHRLELLIAQTIAPPELVSNKLLRTHSSLPCHRLHWEGHSVLMSLYT